MLNVIGTSLHRLHWVNVIGKCHYVSYVWLNGLVVRALGIRAPGPQFDSRVLPLFHWVATLGKLFTYIASAVSQLQEAGVQKGVFGA